MEETGMDIPRPSDSDKVPFRDLVPDDPRVPARRRQGREGVRSTTPRPYARSAMADWLRSVCNARLRVSGAA